MKCIGERRGTSMTLRHASRAAAGAALLVVLGALPARAVEPLKIGILPIATTGPIFIAKEKGYFAAEGFDAEIVPFDAGQPVAVAAVSGAIDFGVAGVTSALYTLAAQGALRIIGGSTYDRPGFHAASIVASNRAYAAGLVSIKELAGHSVGLTQVGSTYHYALAIVAQKFGIDLKTVRTLALQSFTNIVSAVVGGQADTGVLTTTATAPLLARNAAHLLTWVGDEVPWQVGVIWTATRNVSERADTVTRFVRALRRGAHDYDAAFVASDGTRKDGASAPAILEIIAKYTHQPPAQVTASIGYTDPELRIDLGDVARQIAWYRSQGMIKGEVTVDQVIERRYLLAMPQAGKR
jgi:NitT/TauT family transport system substrate-binding protein